MTNEAQAWIDLFCCGPAGDASMPMLSGSMAPALLPGDILTVRSADGTRVHRGDIIVFRDGGRLVAHRLVLAARIASLSILVEKGDANRHASLVEPGSIVGIVAAARRQGETILRDSGESRKLGRRESVLSLARLLSLAALRDFKRRILHRHERV